MKAIMLSIRPEWVAKILNGNKTIEVRKKFPADYVGWVYIYCTKDLKSGKQALTWLNEKGLAKVKTITYYGKEVLGKVVARFWCDKVETIKLPYTKFGTDEWVGCENDRTLQTETMNEKTLLEQSCLSEEEIYKYLNFKHSPSNCGYAIHISKLEIFDKPKDISEFIQTKRKSWEEPNVKRPPQSFMYVEEEE